MKENMLFSGESKNIEYKVTVPDKSEKYMKTVVAFANGKGGKIVFGVDDKTLDVYKRQHLQRPEVRFRLQPEQS